MDKNDYFDPKIMDIDNSRIAYQKFCRDQDLPIFYQPWWLDAVVGSQNWGVALYYDQAKEVIAAFPWYQTRHRGFGVLRMPPLTPYLGPWLTYPANLQKTERKHSFEKKVLDQLIQQLPSCAYQFFHGHPRLTNWLPFYWQNYQQTTRYTYLLKDLNDPKQVFAGFSSGLRNEIRKGEKMFAIREGGTLEQLYQLVEASFRRRKIKIPFTLDFLQTLDKAILENGHRKIFMALDTNEHPIAATYILWDKGSAYCLLIGAAGSRPEPGAVPAVLWKAISNMSGIVPQFDFEGSMIKGVEHLFSGFGGEQIPYFKIDKCANKLIAGLKFWKGY